MSLSELIDATEDRRSAFAEERARLREERRRHESAAEEAERLRARNGVEMAGYLLPDLDDEDLAALERRLHYPSLMVEKRRTEGELATLDAERATIEADPRYVEREVRRVEIDEQLAEIAAAAESFKQDRAVWEASWQFQALLGRGWFADDYDGGLFDWLRDWRACSLLMAELEKGFPGRQFPDDSDVKRGWNELYAQSEPVLGLQRDLVAKQADMDALEARHAAILAAPGELYQALWHRLAGLVVDHLRAAPEDHLVELGTGDETLATFLKKDHGLKKQAAYLRELAVARLDTQIQRFADEERKLAQKAQKLRYKRSRGKYVGYSEMDIERLRDLPYAKWEARRASYGKTRCRIAEFDRWHHGSFVSDFLWWDFMTHGARGDDLYEVRTFHAHHPGWSVDTFVDPVGSSGGGHEAALLSDANDANDLAADAAVDEMMSTDSGMGDPS